MIMKFSYKNGLDDEQLDIKIGKRELNKIATPLMLAGIAGLIGYLLK